MTGILKHRRPHKVIKTKRPQSLYSTTTLAKRTLISTTPITASSHRIKKSYFDEHLEKGVSAQLIGTTDYPFVSTTWVREFLPQSIEENRFKIINASWQMTFDTTSLSLYQSFLSSRIPSALHLDLEECSNTNSHKPLAFTSLQQYATALGRLGIDNDTSVVLYDYNGLLGSAYVHFILTALGLPPENIRILKGGWLQWIDDIHNPVAHDEIIPPPVLTFTPSPTAMQDNFVPDHEMFDLGYAHHLALQNGFMAPELPLIIDTRSPLRYQGLMKEPIGFHQIDTGHIPGSVNVPYADMVCESGPGITLKPKKDLFESFAKVGITHDLPRDTPLILTSGTGATAGVANLALKHMGFTDIRLYESGWLVYGYKKCYPESPRPIEVGDSAILQHLL